MTWATKPATGAEPGLRLRRDRRRTPRWSGTSRRSSTATARSTWRSSRRRPTAWSSSPRRPPAPPSGRCSRSRSRRRSTARRRPRPADLTAEATGSNINLAWTAATDNIGVTNYEIYRDGDLLAMTDNVTSYTDTTGASRDDVRVHRQGARQEREPLRRQQHRVGDGARHAAPDPAREPERHGERRPGRARPGSTRATTSASRATASTTAATRSASVDGATTTSHTVTGLDAGPHTFTVRAIDAAGNLSEPEQRRDRDGARHGQAVRAEQPERHHRPGQVVLTWSGLHRQRGRHRLPDLPERHPGRQRARQRSRRSRTRACTSGNADYTVRAVDAAGNLSDASNTATVNVPDSEKPTAPWFLRATAGTGQVVLNWNGSTDNVGVDRLPDLPQRHPGRERWAPRRAPTRTRVSSAR